MLESYNWQMLEGSARQPHTITTTQELKQRCDYWCSLPMVALDTEFMRVDTFYPIPGLIQVADDQACYLIDPLAIDDFSPLRQLFEATSVVKVMHAASEDLELFLQLTGVLPQPLYDTQLGAGLLNWGFSMGLQRILERCLGIELEKGETTSDWLQRPLTESQERYAALDVAYLAAIYQQQQQELSEREILHWAEQENQALLDNAKVDDVEGWGYYQRFTQMWNLPEHKLAALRDLTAWREQQARLRDVPRNRILRNQALLQIVERWPQTMADLSKLDEVKKSILRRDGETILAILQQGQQSAAAQPPAPIPRPLHYFWNKHLKRLKAIARRKAEEYNTAPELMLKRKELEQLVRSGVDNGEYILPDNIAPWRQSLIGHLLLDALSEIETLRNQH